MLDPIEIEKGPAVGDQYGADLGPTSPVALEHNKEDSRTMSAVENCSQTLLHDELGSPHGHEGEGEHASPDACSDLHALRADMDAIVSAFEDVQLEPEVRAPNGAEQLVEGSDVGAQRDALEAAFRTEQSQRNAAPAEVSGSAGPVSGPVQRASGPVQQAVVGSPAAAPAKPLNLIQKFHAQKHQTTVASSPPVGQQPPPASAEGAAAGTRSKAPDEPEASSSSARRDGGSLESTGGRQGSCSTAPRSPSHTQQLPKRRTRGLDNREYDIEDPAQVLEESLKVLADIQDLICAELQLPSGSDLGMQLPAVLAQVPSPLLSALEETIQVVSEARELLSEPAAQRGRSGQPAGGRAARSYRAGPGVTHYREAAGASGHAAHPSRSPYTNHSGRPAHESQPPVLQRHSRDGQASEAGSCTAASSSYGKASVGRDGLREGGPSRERLEAQEAHRRRVQRVQRDLQLIEKIRSKGVQAQALHEQALHDAEASLQGLKDRSSKSAAYSRWFQFQDALAGR